MGQGHVDRTGRPHHANQFYGTSLETPWGRKIYCEGLENYWLFCRQETPSPTDAVRSLTISNQGTGYPNSGNLTGTGGGGAGFAGTYEATAGKIISVTITNQGSGYTSAPTIGFSPAGNNDAVVTAALGDGYEIEFSGANAVSNTVAWGEQSANSAMIETNGAKANQKIDPVTTNLADSGLVRLTVYETSPPQITSDQNDYDPGEAGVLRLTTDATRTVTGFQKGRRGRYLTVINVGTNILNLAHETGSAAANRISVPGGSSLQLSANRSAVLWYDDVTDRWRVTGFTT